MHCSLPFPSSAAFAEHYVLVHGGGLTRSPSPSPAARDRERGRESREGREGREGRDQDEKPTDLSVGRKTSSRRGGDDKSMGMPPSKRSKANHDLPPLPLDGLMVSSAAVIIRCYGLRPRVREQNRVNVG